jgi:hypothetical protein
MTAIFACRVAAIAQVLASCIAFRGSDPIDAVHRRQIDHACFVNDDQRVEPEVNRLVTRALKEPGNR